MEFETTRCSQCGSKILMGVPVCPNCGSSQRGGTRSGIYQPGTMLAVLLAAAVLLIFHWITSSAPQPSQIASPPSASLPSR